MKILFDSNNVIGNPNYRKVSHFACWPLPSLFWHRIDDGLLIGIVWLKTSHQWSFVKKTKNE